MGVNDLVKKISKARFVADVKGAMARGAHARQIAGAGDDDDTNAVLSSFIELAPRYLDRIYALQAQLITQLLAKRKTQHEVRHTLSGLHQISCELAVGERR